MKSQCDRAVHQRAGRGKNCFFRYMARASNLGEPHGCIDKNQLLSFRSRIYPTTIPVETPDNTLSVVSAK